MKFKDYEETEKRYGFTKRDWLNLQEGENKIRIVSEFEDYGVHYNPNTKKIVICIGKETCSLCQTGIGIRVQYLGWVIDRKDGQVKLLRIGHQIFKQIGEFAISNDYGFVSVPDYDITIKKIGQGLATEYTVLPARQDTELTDEEKYLISEKVKSPKEIIERMKAKVSPEEIPVYEESEEIPILEEEIPICEDDDVSKIP